MNRRSMVDRGAGGHPPAPQGPRYCHGFSKLRPVSSHDYLQKHCLSPKSHAHAKRGQRLEGGMVGGHAWDLWWVLIARRGWSSGQVPWWMPIVRPEGSRQVIRLKPTFKKSSPKQSGALCSNWPKISPPKQKINLDNKANFRYLDNYSFRLMEVSICWTTAKAVTQLAIFAWYPLKKQYLIFTFNA